MLQASVSSALAGAAHMLCSPAASQLASGSISLHSRAQSTQKAKAAVAVAVAAVATDSLAIELFSTPLSGSACSPPRTSHFTRRANHSAVAPAHCIARHKTRRRKQPFGGNGDSGDNDEDVGDPGSNDGDSGSIGGGGGDDWWSAGDGEGGYFRDAFSTLWLWRALCVCSVLQVIHFMILMNCKRKNATIVSVSQSFFSSGLRAQPAGV